MKKLCALLLALCIMVAPVVGCGAKSAAEGGDTFLILIDNESDAEFAYLRGDYYLGGEQLGYMLSDQDEPGGPVQFPFAASEFEYAEHPDDLSDFRLELYLAYSDATGEHEALMQAMEGKPGEEVWFDTLTLSPVYGATYHYCITGDQQSGYRLEAAE